MAVSIYEVQIDPNDPTKNLAGATLASQMHYAWANGTAGADTFSLSDISSATQTLMTTNQRGLWVGLGTGDDTAMGSGFGDNFDMGSGTNYVDGGANAGTTPWGDKAVDTLDLYVSNSTAANAVTVTQLTSGMSGTDATAFAANYTAKVTSGSEVNYIKNVEAVNVQIWNDANSNGQKDWGNNEVTAGKYINLAMNINEIKLDPNDSTKVQGGATLASRMHYTSANGTAGADTFSLSDISSATQTLMTTNQRGVYVSLGAGDDTATGSGFGDNFDMGSGTNYVDGGANAGTTPWGDKAVDTLDLYVSNSTAANAVTVTQLTSGMSGTDATAFAANYTAKVTSGSEVNYIKNVEAVNVQIWNDANSNGQKDWGNNEVTAGKYINLAMNINEIKLDPNDSTKVQGGATLASRMHYTSANGTAGADTFSLSDISSATQTLMTTNQRGVYVSLGAGDDTATGSGFGDNFDMGSGTNYVDGGANAGTTPWGAKAVDTLDLYVSNSTAANAVTVTQLTSGMSGTDATAFAANYTAKVTSGSEVNYIKNVEAVNVQIWNDANSNGQKDWGNNEVTAGKYINLAMNINEIKLDPNDSTKVQGGATLASQMHYTSANGTAGADTFSLSDISSATQTLMTTNQRGVYVSLGAGDDTATGSGFGDNFDMGSGTNYVDGGANAGTTPWGAKAVDTLDLYVSNSTAANAVTVTQLTSGMSGTDATAFAANYTAKVTSGSEVNYIKNVEAVNVQIWNDANSNGQKDWGNNEVTAGKYINLAMNINEIKLDPNDSTKVQGGATLASRMHYTSANGTAGADTFSLSDISSATQTLMTTNQRGVYVSLGAGDDTATGSGFGDNFDMGSGSNYVDGGANAGTTPWGAKAVDTLDLYVSNSTAANAVTVTQLTSGMSGTDATAFAANYTAKVTSGSEVNYIKNVEAVNVQIWNDANSNGQKDWGNNEVTAGKYINLAMNINEIKLDPNDSTKVQGGATLASQMHYTSANGTAGADTFSLSDISSATQTLMTTNQRGVYVSLGAGDDTATGSGFGDNFDMGSGTNYVDGGANAGTTPWGAKAVDTLDLYVSNSTAANAVTVTQLTSGMSGTDATAFAANYTAKVTSGSEVNYIKNVEAVNVQIWNDANSNGQKDWGNNEVTAGKYINLAMNINEIKLDPNDSTKVQGGATLASQMHYTSANGTAGADTFSLSDISSATQTLMTTNQRGVYVSLGAGDDTATGSGFGDNFDMGSGTNYVDGGANAGTTPWGDKAVDTLDLYVSNSTAANAVTVTQLTSGMSGTDATAFAANYTAKVTSGSEVNYIKNVEAVNVQIWNDANSNGQKDWGNNEVTAGKYINLAMNINEIKLDPNDSTKVQGGATLASRMHYTSANGTAGADTFSLSDISSATQTLMTTNQRGVYVSLGAGDDTATGSGFGDNFDMGSGSNYVRWGQRTTPWGAKAVDTLDLYVSNSTAANAVTVTQLTSGMSGTDATAFAANYTAKVTSGSEVNYIKNVEAVNVQIWKRCQQQWPKGLG
jgi:hypothetical protein